MSTSSDESECISRSSVPADDMETSEEAVEYSLDVDSSDPSCIAQSLLSTERNFTELSVNLPSLSTCVQESQIIHKKQTYRFIRRIANPKPAVSVMSRPWIRILDCGDDQLQAFKCCASKCFSNKTSVFSEMK